MFCNTLNHLRMVYKCERQTDRQNRRLQQRSLTQGDHSFSTMIFDDFSMTKKNEFP